MNLTNLIFAVIFTFQVSNIFAGNAETKSSLTSDLTSSAVIMLAPSAPAEADFSDFMPGSDFDLIALAPVTPSFADFNEILPEIKSNTIDLAPESPSFADFDEDINDQLTAVSLVPVTPAAADFD